MGCDIHLYIEYKQAGSDQLQRWQNFGGRINPGRHYGVFAKLAGVRNYESYEIKPLSEPRGMPSDAAYETDGDNRLFITESEGDGHASPENAKRWIESGSSKLIDEKWVTHPDWHSHSWCSTAELQQVLEDPKTQVEKYAHEYFAVLAAMQSFESRGMQARIVFWFDN